ncbi:8038_t:CDS:2 [Funneliformis caledonium]|uniref:8038_t:CDS:1 n=1 Tax=Funneliformis caledonium TaxID=1117310 RepID=A0A9N8WP99_9GLOM|nr:8038_t:CDS:2 [Funneliformis caledonium]
MENTQNYKVWEKKNQITSLKIKSNLIDLELKIDRLQTLKDKIRIISTASETEVKPIYNDLTFSDEESSSSVLTMDVFSETSSQMPNQEQEDTKMIPLIIINKTIQAVARAFFEKMHMYSDSRNKNEDTIVHDYVHDTFKEIFCDLNYEIIWANTESLSSREHRATYGRSKGRKPDITIYRIMKKEESEETYKDEREEACFIEVKHFSVTRNSKIGGYNLYKVTIFCQGGISRIISSRENTPELKSFGGHICKGYIYLGIMDLEYDGNYRYFQLFEIKLAQKLSEFNLIRKLIIETFYFKCRIDSSYSNKNSRGSSSKIDNVSPCRNNFSRHPTITPKAPRSTMIPEINLIEETKWVNKRKSKSL